MPKPRNAKASKRAKIRILVKTVDMTNRYLKRLLTILFIGTVLLACSSSETKTDLNSNQESTETKKEDGQKNLSDKDPEVILAIIQDGTNPPSERLVENFGELLSSLKGYYTDIASNEMADKLAMAYDLAAEKGNKESLLEFVEGFRNGVKNSINSNVHYDFTEYLATYVCYKTNCTFGQKEDMKFFKADFVKEKQANSIVKEENLKNGEEARKARKEFENLFNELILIKDREDFIKYGFAIGGPYNDWLTRAENLEKKYDPKILLDRGIVIRDLQILGLQYVSSKGKETDVTRELNKGFLNGIAYQSNDQQTDEYEAGKGIDNYNKIKRNYKRLGKWIVSNLILEQKGHNSTYKYAIYKTSDKIFIGVFAQANWEYETEVLEKIGDKYFIRGNNPQSENGEYYKIDSNLNMTLFDETGDLTEYGWTTKKDY